MYDYLVVGSGLYGAIFAHEAKVHGKSVLVVDKRPNIAGNIYTENVEGINVHKYGAHIFHTNNKKVWSYITQFAEFNRFTNSPVANYRGELYSLPFNMYTFNKMWGVVTPEEAATKIEEQRKEIAGEPQNLEEQAISLVGRDIYEKLIKGYTEKQWGRDCKELPSFIIKRLPVRLTFDNNYFNGIHHNILWCDVFQIDTVDLARYLFIVRHPGWRNKVIDRDGWVSESSRVIGRRCKGGMPILIHNSVCSDSLSQPLRIDFLDFLHDLK